MNVGSTFSGIGGLDRGLELAGMRIAWQAESDEWCRGILAHHYPGVPCYHDVKEVGVNRVPWNKGKSYTVAAREVYANKGAWADAMRRMHRDECMRCGWDEARCDIHHIVPKRDGGEMSLDNGIVLCPNCHRLAEAGVISSIELVVYRDQAPVIGEQRGVVVPKEAPRVDLISGGFPQRAKTSASQDAEPDSPELAADCSSSSRESLRLFDPPGCSSRMFPGSDPRMMVGTSASFLERWPTSGTASPGECSIHATSESPNDAVECSLSDVLETTVAARYALSARAARGVLRRSLARGRPLPPALEEALREAAE